MLLTACRGYRKTQLILTIDLIYPILWIIMYKYVDVVNQVGTFADWTWRLFFGWMVVTMFACSSRALYRTIKEGDIQPVYHGMLDWLFASILFSCIQWIANGVLNYWAAFWITIILRFFMIIATALFIIDVRRLSKEDAAQNLQTGMQLTGSGSRINSSFKCKIM